MNLNCYHQAALRLLTNQFDTHWLCLLNACASISTGTLCRHERIKSYRFVLVTAGLTLCILHGKDPKLNHTVFPAVGNALLNAFDQVGWQRPVQMAFHEDQRLCHHS